jgi:hypothetical protein
MPSVRLLEQPTDGHCLAGGAVFVHMCMFSTRALPVPSICIDDHVAGAFIGSLTD